jgi:hypothetical protein
MGMGMGVNPYPPVYMGDPVGLFLCRGYEYGVVIPGGYLPIVAEPPELFQLKCLSHASGAVTHLNRNNPSVLQI